MSDISNDEFEDWFQHYQDAPWEGDRFETVMAEFRMKLFGKPGHHDLYPFLWKTHEYEEGVLGDDGKRRFRNRKLPPAQAAALQAEYRNRIERASANTTNSNP